VSTAAKLIDEPPLVVLPSLAVAVGLNEALALQQIHFRGRDAAGGWWRASMSEVRTQFPFWSEATLKRTLRRLRQLGLIEVEQGGTDRTNRYRIDHQALAKRVPRARGGQVDPMEGVRLASNRPDGRGQVAPVSSLSLKRNGNGRGKDAPTPGKYVGLEREL
jgi:hypothetical protein